VKHLRAFFLRLFGSFGKSRREREFIAEYESHLAMHIEDNLRAGMSPELARREALLRSGATESLKESMRDRWTLLWLETTRQDIRYALRGLSRSPAFSITVLLSLALGLGASIAIFTITDDLLLRPLPYPHPSELTMVWESNRRSMGTDANVVSPGNYLDWKAVNSVFQSMAAFNDIRTVLTVGDRAEELHGQEVSFNFFPTLGAHPLRGRAFDREEDGPGSHPVILISYRVWQGWFAGDENVIGRKVQVNGAPRTIIGVMPPSFCFRNRAMDLWEPIGLNPAQDYRKTEGRWMMCVARMKPGVTQTEAQADMTTISRRLESAYPSFNKNWTVNVERLKDSLVKDVRTSLLVLLGAVGLLLAVACANVANLLLARYTSRRREMAVRVSLGAGRWRVVRQLLTESIILGLAGGVLGLALAKWAIMGLLALAPKELTEFATVSVDWRILLFALALSIVTGILFGLAPSLVTSRLGLTQALNNDNRSNIGGGSRLRAWLVAAEVALSVILLTGALLLFRSLAGLQAVSPGLNPANLLTFRVTLPKRSQSTQFFQQALEGIRHLPGVKSAGAISYLPFDGMAAATKVDFAGRPPAKPGEELIAVIRTVMPGYMETMDIPLAAGRGFTAADNVKSAPYRFLVNQTFVRKFLPSGHPLYNRISTWMDSKNPFGQIIGVVGDVKEGALDKEPMPTVYYVHAHLDYSRMVLVVRTAGPPLQFADSVRRVIKGIDPLQPIAQVRTMDEVLGETFSRQRFSTFLLSGFSLTSLLLAAIGIYGVLSYSVSERTREIGVRISLGAEPAGIVALVVNSGMRLVVGGACIGVAGAIALTGLLKSLLFKINPHDPLTFILVPFVLGVVALVAAYLPARRPAHLDPMQALRAD
jgi:predicted permease